MLFRSCLVLGAEEEIGQAMVNANANGDSAFMVTKVVLDPHAGEIAVGRLFSGSIKKGDQMYVAGMPNANRVQSVGMFVGGAGANGGREEVGKGPLVVGLVIIKGYHKRRLSPCRKKS